MATNEFSLPQRMSPAALVIIFTKRFRQCLAPLSIAGLWQLIDNYSSDKLWLLILLTIFICFAVPLVWALISYLPTKFHIQDGNLVFTHGLIDHEDTVVPFDRVHSLRTEKGLWYRILDMRGVIFDTLATRQEEIELILDEYDWQQLKAEIDKTDSPPSEQDLPDLAPACCHTNQTHTVRYPSMNLFLACLCQNHLKGMAVFASLFGILLGNLQDLSAEATHTLAAWLEAFTDSLSFSPLNLLLFLGAAYLFTLVYWLGKTLLRYYYTTLTYDKDILTFSFGLITRASSRFFFDRICAVSIKRNFLEKRFGFCTLKLHQALNATAEKDEDNLKLYGSDSYSFFLSWWLGKDYAQEEDILTARSGKGVLYRFVALRGVVVAAIGTALVYSELYLWAILPALYFLCLIPGGMLARRHSRIELKATYCIIHGGSLAETDNYIKYSDIEVVGIRRSPLSRWSHRVALALCTSGTTFIVRSLCEEEAFLIRECALSLAEAGKP